MFLKKFTIGLALSSIVVSGAVQATNLTQQTIKIYQIKKESKVKTVNEYNPFNPATLVHSVGNQNRDFYAYFKGDVFPSKYKTPRYGYELQMGSKSMQYLIWSYQEATINQNGGMLSYLTGAGPYFSPFSGDWVYHNTYEKDSYGGNDYVFAKSFASGPSGEAMVQDALNKGQTITFFFESQYNKAAIHKHWGRVIEANIDTGQNITTPWYYNPLI